MNFYTSYFAKLKSFPGNIVPVSICGKAPDWYNGLQYTKLSPKYDFFIEWKKSHDNDYYIKCFTEQVLEKLSAEQVVKELKLLCSKSGILNFDICLICYEKPEDFCHRHLVAEWLTQNDYPCKEWDKSNKKKPILRVGNKLLRPYKT